MQSHGCNYFFCPQLGKIKGLFKEWEWMTVFIVFIWGTCHLFQMRPKPTSSLGPVMSFSRVSMQPEKDWKIFWYIFLPNCIYSNQFLEKPFLSRHYFISQSLNVLSFFILPFAHNSPFLSSSGSQKNRWKKTRKRGILAYFCCSSRESLTCKKTSLLKHVICMGWRSLGN